MNKDNKVRHLVFREFQYEHASVTKDYQYSWGNRFCSALIYIRTGELHFCNGPIPFRAGARELIYVPKGQTYTVISKEETEFIVVNARFSSDDLSVDQLNFDPNRLFPVMRTIDYSRDVIERLMKEFLFCCNSKVFYNEVLALSVLARIWSVVIRGALHGDEGTIAQRARDYIDKNPYDRVPVSEICDFLSVSRTKLFQAFREEYGSTPSEYRDRVFIAQAEQLLFSGKHSISEISRFFHFSQPSSFTVTFKRITGRTPRELLEQNRAKTKTRG